MLISRIAFRYRHSLANKKARLSLAFVQLSQVRVNVRKRGQPQNLKLHDIPYLVIFKTSVQVGD